MALIDQSDPKVVQWHPSLSQHSQWIESCEWIRSRSGSCCCAASACHCPSPAFFFCSCGRSLDVLGHQSSMRQGGGAQQERLCRGECCRPDLSRRRGRVSTNVMVIDLDIAQENSDSRRLVIAEGLSRSATGSGRDIGVCAPWRWNAAEESRHNQWSGSEARLQTEGRQVPRTVWGGRKSEDGGCCW